MSQQNRSLTDDLLTKNRITYNKLRVKLEEFTSEYINHGFNIDITLENDKAIIESLRVIDRILKTGYTTHLNKIAKSETK